MDTGEADSMTTGTEGVAAVTTTVTFTVADVPPALIQVMENGEVATGLIILVPCAATVSVHPFDPNKVHEIGLLVDDHVRVEG